MANRTKRLSRTKRSAPVRFSQLDNLRNLYTATKGRLMFKKRYDQSIVFAQRRPFASFFVALGILFLLILLGSTIFRTKSPEIQERSTAKNVEVFRIGASPRISVQGEVTKSGVITIVAQTPGIVNTINFNEGEEVLRGQVLLNLSSNYQGANAFTLQRQLAGVTYQNTKESYELQKDLIQKQKDVANLQSENSEELRKITEDSIDETRSLVDLNRSILDTLRSNIETLENTNADPQQILSLQQLQAQLQGGTNQLLGVLRANEYQIDTDNPPTKLVGIGKELALKQLDLQEKALKMSLEAAGIQFKLAQVQESTMYPSAPCGAIIQKIHVKVGDSVNPGDPLVTIASDGGEVVIDAKVPKKIAAQISKIDKSVIEVEKRKIELVPSYISSEATDGQLYSVLFTLDNEYKKYFTDNAFVSISLPIGQTIDSTTPIIPVDSVFQTQDEAFVFIAEGAKAKSKKVKLGAVTGGFVTVEQGLLSTDQVILNRTVIDGEAIRIQN